jgi:hypothetical protein
MKAAPQNDSNLWVFKSTLHHRRPEGRCGEITTSLRLNDQGDRLFYRPGFQAGE